jgi:DNA-binding MarR family transcriptional regulator
MYMSLIMYYENVASNPALSEQAVERAMVTIRRRQRRRQLAERVPADLRGAISPAVTELLDAVEGEVAAGREVTVTGLTRLLAVDQPRVSKLTRLAVSAGLLRRLADQQDGRRSTLELTAEGIGYLDAVHRHRQARFARAMDGWTDAERADFAALLTRFVSALEAGN